MLRLSDLIAPEWTVHLSGTTFRLRPLSLAVFSEAEGVAISLNRLSRPQDVEVWVELLAFLTGRSTEDEDLLASILTDPVGFEQFRNTVASTFTDEESDPNEAAKKGRRKVQMYKPDVKAEPNEDANTDSDTDYGFVLDIARTSGLSLHDILRMTFRGLLAIEKSLERLPPSPGLGSMLG